MYYGLKRCTIQLGNYSLKLDAKVSKNLPEQYLLGFDFLEKHPSTKNYIIGLNNSIKDVTNYLDTLNDIHLSK